MPSLFLHRISVVHVYLSIAATAHGSHRPGSTSPEFVKHILNPAPDIEKAREVNKQLEKWGVGQWLHKAGQCSQMCQVGGVQGLPVDWMWIFGRQSQPQGSLANQQEGLMETGVWMGNSSERNPTFCPCQRSCNWKNACKQVQIHLEMYQSMWNLPSSSLFFTLYKEKVKSGHSPHTLFQSLIALLHLCHCLEEIVDREN